MAKILNKDPVTYQKERDGFQQELRQFHDSRGTPFRRVPKLHGHEVDLYLLYVLVTAHGGWEKVNSRSEWDSLAEQFGVPHNCVNGGIALKQIYIRFLERYEKVHFLGEDVDRDDEDDEMGEGRGGGGQHHRRWSARILHNVPLAYNHNQHQVSDAARQSMGLSTDTFKASEYDRLSLSLLCPLPNEHDFAINVCTLLSNEGKHTLRLEKCPRLVDLLLAHAGVYTQSSLREVFLDMYANMRRQSISHFWADVVEERDFRELADPPRLQDDILLRALAASAASAGSTAEEKESAPSEANATVWSCSSAPPSPSASSLFSCRTEGGCGSSTRLQDSRTCSLACSRASSPLPGPSTLEGKQQAPDPSDCEMLDLSGAGELRPPQPPESASGGDVQTVIVGDKEVKVTVDEKPKIRMIEVSEEDMPRLPVRESASLLRPAGLEGSSAADLFHSSEDAELFCLGRGLGTQDPLGQRVLQVATILRNLSFEEDNIPVLGKNSTFVRFALLCMQSRHSCLAQLGMDMLGQVASEVVLEDPHADTLAAMLVSSVARGLFSPDRFAVLSCLEVLNKLAQNEDNEDLMLKCLEQKVYDQICSFLTLHDIMLLIYTLECLYSLSSLGERACNSIVRVHGAIDTLVSLITVEAQSYGPRACILMRVVERLQDQGAAAVGQQTAGNTQSSNLTTLTSLTPVTPVRQTPIISRQTITPHRPLLSTPASSSATPVQSTPQPLQQQHQHQQQLQENEQFALAWLRATYEPASGHSVEQGELYRQYLASCAKIGRRGVIAALHFPRCVRSVFGGSVGPNARQSTSQGASSSSPEYHYVGIKVRASAMPLLATPSSSSPAVRRTVPTPLPALAPAPERPSPTVTPTPEPAAPAISPILKAQLSAPPKQTTKPEAKSQVLAHPHLTQALLGSSSSSSTTQQPQSPQQQQTPQASSAASVAAVAAPRPVSQSATPQPGPSTSSSSSSSATPTSLIKSLLASKVNVGESMSMPSIVPPSATTSSSSSAAAAAAAAPSLADVQQHQVAQRQQQQRLLQQQLQASPPPLQPITPVQRPPRPPVVLRPVAPPVAVDTKSRAQVARVNGARGLPLASTTPAAQSSDAEAKEGVTENHVTSPPPRKEQLLPPPPPRPQPARLDEDSDSAASTANSQVSSSGAVSTDGDGENSLTSFEGILQNGIPHSLDIDAANDTASNDGSRSCDSSKEVKTPTALKMKGMLADLLEKKSVTKEPMINGVLGKELRISDKGLELVENHVDKAVKQESEETKIEPPTPEQIKLGVKRSSTSSVEAPDTKRPLLSPPVNGNAHSNEAFPETSNEVKAESQESKAESVVKPELTPVVQAPIRQLIIAAPASSAATATTTVETSTGQQLIMAPRQIIMAPGSLPQMITTQGGTQLKGQLIMQQGPRQVLVPTPGGGGTMQMATGQMLVTTQAGGSGQPQYILTQPMNAGGQTYVVAQSQGLVQGQTPTVLVTQTPQQQGTNAKTIIILHQQGGQKVGGQGQQVMLQLPRSAVQGGGATIQGVTLSQGVGGQMTVTLPGGGPAMVARTVATTPVQMQKPIQVVAARTPGVATSAIVANPAKKLAVTATTSAPASTATVTATTAAANPQASTTPVTTAAGAKPAVTTATPTTTTVAGARPAQSQQPRPEPSPFLCEWRGCMRSFKSANEVYMHACRTHCPTGSEDVQCLWERCDGMKRKRFSLMTHLYDRHCNSDVLRMMAVRRKQMAQSGRSEIPPPQPPPPHPGYAPNAALHAIKRHALEFVNPKELMQQRAAAAAAAAATSSAAATAAAAATSAASAAPAAAPPSRTSSVTSVTAAPPVVRPPAEQNAEANASRTRLSFQDDNEGPVTKSIRLTSSLILRNLVIYSTNGRRFLRSYEPHLASVALSNVESSRTVAQVLYDMSHGGEQS